ncbi:glycosyltransferase 87 family protein [Variovorax sp. GT1P44]|uniref:glycosyltransferase 87 family protein n=1 Tax=Variovorax sp. GT1P44 TaxID=3443742 RepID=UPI003F46315A
MLATLLACQPAAGRSADRIGAYVLCTVLATAWTAFAGKDVPWDALHYHLYAGYSVFHDRVAIDYFPAGPQTYFVPYAHAPLSLMVGAGWPSLAIGIAFACLHSLALWLTWELARAVSRDEEGRSPALVIWSAVALALANPALLQALGSSFTDITTGTLALGGYVALVNSFHAHRVNRLALAGVLLGAAAALKMSNAVFALMPALPLVLGSARNWRTRWQGLLLFGACAAGALVLIGGAWAYALWTTFGNPLFPMLDGLFNPAAPVGGAVAVAAEPASPLFRLLGAMDVMRDPRFLPSSLAEAFMRPFDMLAARRMIHMETMAADMRYAALMCLPVLWLVVTLRRRSQSAPFAAYPPSQRAWASLTMSFLVAWVLWLLISGNSRYFIPMACIAAVILIAGVHRVLSGMPRVQGYAVMVLLGVQALLLYEAADLRWSAQPWDGAWTQATVPTNLKSQPFLYLSMDSQSQSFLVPSLAPGSAFVGMGADVDPEGRDGQRIRALIKTHSPQLRMLTLVRQVELDGRPIAPAAATFDYPLRRLGLRVDVSDCEYIRYRGYSDAIEQVGPRSGSRDQIYVYTCRLVPGDGLSDAELASKRLADQVLDRVERACPDLFRSRHTTSVRNGSIWRRGYPDFAIWVNDDGWVRFADLLRGGGDFSGLGSANEWIKSPRPLKCWRERGRFHVERSDF